MLVPVPLVHRLPLPANRRFERARARLEETIPQVIAQYRAGQAPGDDLLSLVMAATDDDGRPLSEREVRDQIMSVLAAGVETTACPRPGGHRAGPLVRLPGRREPSGDRPRLPRVVSGLLPLRELRHHPGHLPRLLALLDAMDKRRRQMDEQVWWQRYGSGLPSRRSATTSSPASPPNRSARPTPKLTTTPTSTWWKNHGSGPDQPRIRASA
jgi:hypothetical protein